MRWRSPLLPLKTVLSYTVPPLGLMGPYLVARLGSFSAYRCPDKTNGHSSLELEINFFLLFGEDCSLPFFLLRERFWIHPCSWVGRHYLQIKDFGGGLARNIGMATMDQMLQPYSFQKFMNSQLYHGRIQASF